MATENQNFFKHFKDTFIIVFTVTDVEVDLTNYQAYWAAATSPSSSVLVAKSTSTPFDDPSDAPGAGGITISNQTINVSITQSDFTSNAPGGNGLTEIRDYYHELTIGDEPDGSDSVVIASGILTIKEDLFGYR